MQYIDEKFKDCNPAATVEKIIGILDSLDIKVTENWNDSGVGNCDSLTVSAGKGIPSANGKGISKEFARASAYGEFIERLQGGLFFYKYQSMCRNPDMNLQSFAPDGKYVTMEELIRDGEWMDYLVDAYKQYGVTRESIAEQCRAFACADEGRILTIPFYSLFEKKYVYLPAGFVDQMYASNGCCAGNTREEAWVHAFSEMMERHASIKMLLEGSGASKIPDDVLERYPTVSKILAKLREDDEFDVSVFDYSLGNGFPVVSTRIISKKDHSYRVNVAADPVFEIALQRTLTELFQGKNLYNVTKKHSGRILGKVSDISPVDNVINQLETSSGLYSADYFANELTCSREFTDFTDNSNKTNSQLLEYMLDLYRKLGKPVYVRNFSYLGFHSYRFVVPGFSEALAVRLGEMIPEYALADEHSKILRDVASASDEDLSWMLTYSDMIRGVLGRYHHFSRISGIPLQGNGVVFASTARAYAAYRLKRYQDAIGYINACIHSLPEEEQGYFSCIKKYLELRISGIDQDKIKSILFKFFRLEDASKLYGNLEQGKTPFDEYLVCCHFTECEKCRHREICCYQDIQAMNIRVGQEYRKFVNGQDASEFAIS